MSSLKNNLAGKVIVITGASGYIGSVLVKELTKYSLKIIRVSRKKIARIEDVEDWILDLNTIKSWNRIVSKADIIFHLASNTSLSNTDANPEESLISTVFPINHLANAAKQNCRVPRVIFTSTATVYGITDTLPVLESTKPIPITLYDLHKLFAEQLLSMASHNEIISATSLRLANVYGPSLKYSRADDRGILTKVTKNRLAGNNIQVFGNGNYVRDYVYIDDVVSALLHTSIISDADDTYNVGSGIGSTIKDVFNLISSEVKNCTGVSANVENVTWPKNYNKIDKRNYIASIEQLKTASDWSPKIFLEEGIQRLVRYYSIGKIND